MIRTLRTEQEYIGYHVVFDILQTYPHIKQINHKCLVKGHNHMEADNVHALIEKKTEKCEVKSLAILTGIGKNLVETALENIMYLSWI